ncbi:MAG: MraZ protein [Parcubacteria group bacterium Gr01-1014_18]|nr:MAG: MraZ protein [Parcubacteria group bacterium Greene0416_36]TSC81575.1 MAG: MraZ protein [Parcubacteria group bacterium Gr01-1014_18]TSC99614.1 MAG: MraZ protein [Parcubacteria group bacterium Greene1014_20]TSD07065.1 MAG: MraZ protein [Parcubacteria group bacterium Greene0714_2]
MFIGQYFYSLDDKGRLSLPVKFRESLGRGAVVTRGLDGCLTLYALDEWKTLAQKLATLPINKSDGRAFSRFVLSGAMDVGMDRAGRIVIPEYLRVFAKISKKTVVVGLYNKVEIWNEEAWTRYQSDNESSSSSIAEKLGDFSGTAI